MRVLLAALFATTMFDAAAQTQKPAAKSQAIRRMPDGHPDLQGIYDVATLTQMERIPGVGLSITKEQAAAVEAAVAQARAKGDEPIQGERTAPPSGGANVAATLGKVEDKTGFVNIYMRMLDAGGGKVGGYNIGWLDPGSGFATGRSPTSCRC